MKYYILLLIIFLFSGCTNLLFETKNNVFSLNSYDAKLLKIELTNPVFKHRFDSCVYSGYTINDNNKEYGELFIEHIGLKDDCQWNGLSRSFYEFFIKQKLSIKRMKLLQRVDLENYEFSKYLIDGKCNLYLIFIYQGNSVTFLIDQEGKLYRDVLKKFNYKNDTGTDTIQKCNFIFDGSLIKENIWNRYFQREKPLLPL